MLATTNDVIRTVLKSDPTVAVNERNRLLTLLRQGDSPKKESTQTRVDRIVRRHEGAERLGLSLRAYDKLVAELGLRRKLPGRKRSCGIREADLENIIGGR